MNLSSETIQRNLRTSSACYHYYKKSSLIIHTVCGGLSFGCFLYCLCQPALWQMESSSEFFLNGKVYYFNAFRGLGSQTECFRGSGTSLCPGPNYSIFCDKFCWFWQIPGPWRAVDHLSSAQSHVAHEALIVWFTVPYLMFICALTALLGTVLLVNALRMKAEYQTFLIQYLRQISEETPESHALSCSSLHRRTCFNQQNTAIFCFFLTSVFSHVLLLGLSLSDSLNPRVWQQFLISFVSPSSDPSIDVLTEASSLNITFTSSGWIFLTGILLSYFIWIGMLLVWTQFPVTCLKNITNPTTTTLEIQEIELPSVGRPPLRNVRPQTEPGIMLDRTKNPLSTVHYQQRVHTV